MKTLIKVALLLTILVSCEEFKESREVGKTIDWKSRTIENLVLDSLISGKTYLPVYSHIYHQHEHRTFDLTITVSIRNTSISDSIFILGADYFDTSGKNIRQYAKNPVYVKPMETLEIIIAEEDKEGGSGANFLFHWAAKSNKNIPLFEAVMISTHGQQGLSFSTRGVQIAE